jgi:N-acyl-D-amino-acid deacylase
MGIDMKRILSLFALVVTLSLGACSNLPVKVVTQNSHPSYDLIIKGGTVYDGTGQEGVLADIGIKGEKIAAIGDLKGATSKKTLDAKSMAVAPGFINNLSWANESLLIDGRSQSDIRQGVTLEVMGESQSMGPINETMRANQLKNMGDLKYSIPWTTFGEYLDYLVKKSVSTNVASFVGAETIRVHELGETSHQPNAEELRRMQDLVRASMREGALGVGSALIYAPGSFASTDELVALASAAHEYGGGYISHMRSEADRYLEGIDELIEIGKRSGAWVQMYHIKPAGQANWHKSQAGLDKMDAARASGLDISANMYTYTAGATGFDASMPTWVQDGGLEAWVARLKDPNIRAKVIAEMRVPAKDWESLYLAAGGAKGVKLLGFKTEALKPLIGKTLDEVAKQRGTSPEDTIIDLIIADNSRIEVAYFLMSEENIQRNIRWKWTMFSSDALSQAPEGVFLKSSAHPRTYGNFARLLGKYVREEKVIPLTEAIHRLTGLSATQLRLRDRGFLKVGYAADVVVFDPNTIQDHATYDKPHQYSTGVKDVVVNGQIVLLNGEHTNARPGQVVRGPGWTGWDNPVRPAQ